MKAVVTVGVMIKPAILDPQGKTVEKALRQLQFTSIQRVRIGKLIEIEINAENLTATRDIASECCKKLLANPIMEDWAILSILAEH